jgi:hypothetical protein
VINPNLLRGERIWLAALSRADAAVMARWEYDSEYLRLIDTSPARPRTEDEIARVLDGVSRSNTEFTFGIRLIDSDDLIGWAQLDAGHRRRQSQLLGSRLRNGSNGTPARFRLQRN